MAKPPEQLDVDVRFLLANERTLLAWVRTSLAIEAGGLALAQLHRHHMAFGVVIMLAGAFAALIGYSRFRAADRAIRRGTLPHAGYGPTIEVAMVVLIALVLAVAEVTVLK